MQPVKCKWKGREDFWKIDVSAKKSGIGKRVKQYFQSERAAKEFVIRVNHVGLVAAVAERDKITPKIEDYPPSLKGVKSDAPTVRDCVAKYMKTKAKTAKATQRQYRYVLGALVADFGGTPIDVLTHREIDPWLASIPGGEMNEFRHYSVGKQFFRWCQDWLEVIPRNPFAKIFRQRPEAQKEILSVEEMRHALRIASFFDDNEVFSYLVLGGFQGMRSCEILRMRWEEIDWEAGEIKVANPKKTKRGIRPRWIKIQAPAMAFLQWIGRTEGRVITRNRKNFYIAFSRLWDKSSKDRLDFNSWPINCLRHSFGTYHLAAFKDGPLTSSEMGHADAQTKYSHYVKEMRQKTALEWWNIHLVDEFDEWLWRAFDKRRKAIPNGVVS